MKFIPCARLRPPPSNTVPIAAMLAGAAAAFWTGVTVIQGPLSIYDSSGYVALADALQRGHAAVSDRPDRTPGYPLFLIVCRAVGGVFGWSALGVTTVLQTILVAGLGTWLVFDMARRLGGTTAAIAAALVYAADANVQIFGRAILTEAQATWLIVATGWLRIRDRDWHRARWLLAALALTRPHLAVIAGAMSAVELVRSNVGHALALVAPTVLAVLIWIVFAQLTGGQPIDASRRIQALCQFGTAYDAQLWRRLPPGSLHDALAGSWERHDDVYEAAGALTGQTEPWNPGADWQPIASAATAMIRADPLGYLWARVRLIPAVYETSAFPWPALAALGSVAPKASNISWWAVAQIGRLHHAIFYGSFALFLILGLATWWNGVGFASAVPPLRWVILPLIAILLASTAMLSLSNDQIGRLAVPAHPFVNLLWGIVLARACNALCASGKTSS